MTDGWRRLPSYKLPLSPWIRGAKEGHNSVNISWNSLKNYHLNIDPMPYAKYQNPSSSGSQDSVFTKFFYYVNGRVEKEA